MKLKRVLKALFEVVMPVTPYKGNMAYEVQIFGIVFMLAWPKYSHTNWRILVWVDKSYPARIHWFVDELRS